MEVDIQRKKREGGGVFKSVTNSFQETLHVVWEEVLFCSFD